MSDLENRHEKYMEEINKYRAEVDAFWNSLSKEDQIKAFYAVSERIYQGEILDQGTYRHVLYSVFGFGSEAYAKGMDCGYFAIHNTLCDGLANPSSEPLEIP